MTLCHDASTLFTVLLQQPQLTMIHIVKSSIQSVLLFCGKSSKIMPTMLYYTKTIINLPKGEVNKMPWDELVAAVTFRRFFDAVRSVSYREAGNLSR